MTKVFAVFVFFMCASTFISAQKTYSVNAETAAPEITITGASTLHGWKAVAGEISEYPSSLSLDVSTASEIENFGFSVSVESLDGGRGSAMNDKIFKAFNSKENPQIVFKQTEALSLPEITDGSKVSLSISGSLEMAGQSADISIPIDVEMVDGNLKFSGAYPLKMTDFGITPPSAMFGQIVTEDDIEVQYVFEYLKN